jgi:MFS family permease
MGGESKLTHLRTAGENGALDGTSIGVVAANGYDAEIATGQDAGAEGAEPLTLTEAAGRPSARSVYAVFLLFVTTDILLSVDSGALPVALPQITTRYHLSRFGQGLLGALSPAGFALATTFVGVLLQSRSPRSMLTAGLAITALCSAAFAAAPTPAVLFLTRLGYGVAYAVFFVFAPVWITLFAPEHRATSWISLIQAGAPIGAVVGMDCAGVVAGASLSWRITFFIQGIVIAACMVAFCFVPKRLVDGDGEGTADYSVPASNVSAGDAGTAAISRNVDCPPRRNLGQDDHHAHVRRGHVLDLALSPRLGGLFHPHLELSPHERQQSRTSPMSTVGSTSAGPRSSDNSHHRGIRYDSLMTDDDARDGNGHSDSPERHGRRELSPLQLPAMAIDMSGRADECIHDSDEVLIAGPGSSDHVDRGNTRQSTSIVRVEPGNSLVTSPSRVVQDPWTEEDEDPRLRTRALYRHMAGPSLALEPDALNSVLLPTWREQLALLAGNRVFVYASLALGFLTFTVEGIRYWVVLYRTEVFHDDLGSVVAAFTLVSATAPILGMFLGGGMIDSIGGYRTKEGVARSMRILMIFSLCAGPSAAAILLGDLGTTSSLKGFAISTWFLLFFGGAHVAPLTGIMIAVVPSEMKSLGSAVSLLVNHVIGFFFAPFGIGIIANARGIKLGFQTVISMSAVAILFALLGWLAAEKEASRRQSGYSQVSTIGLSGRQVLQSAIPSEPEVTRSAPALPT